MPKGDVWYELPGGPAALRWLGKCLLHPGAGLEAAVHSLHSRAFLWEGGSCAGMGKPVEFQWHSTSPHRGLFPPPLPHCVPLALPWHFALEDLCTGHAPSEKYPQAADRHDHIHVGSGTGRTRGLRPGWAPASWLSGLTWLLSHLILRLLYLPPGRARRIHGSIKVQWSPYVLTLCIHPYTGSLQPH